MITANNIERLENLVAHYAMQDYLRVNPRRKKWSMNRKHNPYTLSPLTNEAREMLHLARQKDIDKEDEEEVKVYLLRQKMIGVEDEIYN